ncbi:MAG: 4Fe-4S binding protein [Clostridiales bacterium]|nr:4Fe-4S binding protein [Clostridiales bacterium]
MKIAVLGDSFLCEKISSATGDAHQISFYGTGSEIASIRGGFQEFIVKSRSSSSFIETNADSIIFSSYSSPIAPSESACSTVAFFLDADGESSDSITRRCLESASALALVKGEKKKSRQILFLAKYVRTAGSGMETLYKTARSNGVLFFKYNEASYSGGVLTFKDGDGEYLLEGASVVQPQEESSSYEKLLSLCKMPSAGFFLHPSLTLRRGVYAVKPMSGLFGEIDAQISFILGDLASQAEPLSYAQVDKDKCAACLTCMRVCPHGAMMLDEGGSSMRNLNKSCFACGICAGMCPAKAITMKAASAPALKLGRRKLFYCENCLNASDIPPEIDAEALICGGGVEMEKILKCSSLYDTVSVASCFPESCRHGDGNAKALLFASRCREYLRCAGADEFKIKFFNSSKPLR